MTAPHENLSSEQWWARSQKVLAGGVTHEGRKLPPHPTYFARGEGARKWDVEGREYIDYAMGSAAIFLGHSHPDVVAAVTQQIPLGVNLNESHPLEVRWGELVQELIPSAERVRFVASGTEATMLALRLGRAFSGRDKVMRFEGHFHGWHDFVAYGMKAPFDQAPSLGILPAIGKATVVAPTDPNRVEELLKADPEIGTIICEASGANWACVPLPANFHADLRALADRYEAVLIFDEVITGFRWSPGGMQANVGVTPDLTTMAKVAAGGMPGGVVGGREAIMALLDPAHEFKGKRPAVLHRGTFNGNPLVAAAAVATLENVKTGAPGRQADLVAAKLREGLQAVLDVHQVPGAVYGESSVFHVAFGDDAADAVAACDAARLRGAPKALVDAYQTGLRKRGVDFMSYLGGVTSAAHTLDDVPPTLEAFAGVIQELISAGLVGK